MRMGASVEPGSRVPAADNAEAPARRSEVRPGRVPAVARALVVEGVVQGVGFRPFVWRLATELGLAGRVRNAAGRVRSRRPARQQRSPSSRRRLKSDAPPRARVERVTVHALEAAGTLPTLFEIDESTTAATTDRLFPPDIATCDDCLRELFDPADRRHRYPFTNWHQLRPRATIIDELPYDRAQTTMRDFPLCEACAAEYRDPANRRFHAEPVACPTCGPSLTWRPTGAPAPTHTREDAFNHASKRCAREPSSP